MKDFRKLEYFFEVAYSKQQGIYDSQRKYVFGLLEEKIGCKLVSVPIEQKYKMRIEQETVKVEKV